jgi:hypothetical protein
VRALASPVTMLLLLLPMFYLCFDGVGVDHLDMQANNPGAATEDWIHGGRGVQYRIADLSLQEGLEEDTASGWWSSARVRAMYRAAGQPVTQVYRDDVPAGESESYLVPYLDFQGLSIRCNRTSLLAGGNQTLNGTDYSMVLGKTMPDNIQQHLTTCVGGMDSRQYCARIEITYHECVAEFYCEGFLQHADQMREWCKCPPGYYSATGFGPCKSCPQTITTCDSALGRTFCAPCPVCTDVQGGGLDSETSDISEFGYCQCPLGYVGVTTPPPGNSWPGQTLGPCQICDYGFTQGEVGSATCSRCPPSRLMTDTTRYTRNPTWDWQKLHAPHTLQQGATGRLLGDSCIDIMVEMCTCMCMYVHGCMGVCRRSCPDILSVAEHFVRS